MLAKLQKSQSLWHNVLLSVACGYYYLTLKSSVGSTMANIFWMDIHSIRMNFTTECAKFPKSQCLWHNLLLSVLRDYIHFFKYSNLPLGPRWPTCSGLIYIRMNFAAECAKLEKSQSHWHNLLLSVACGYRYLTLKSTCP